MAAVHPLAQTADECFFAADDRAVLARLIEYALAEAINNGEFACAAQLRGALDALEAGTPRSAAPCGHLECARTLAS